MANRYLRGTFTRNAWDFYELGTAFVFGNYFPGSGPAGFVFRNNGIAQSYLDVFRVEVTSSQAAGVIWSIASPSSQYTAIEPTNYYNVPVQLDLGAPPGDMSVFVGSPSWFPPILKERCDSVTFDSIELANGGPFLTLPPLYGLAINFNMPAAGQIAMSVWYQSITDHNPPAT